MNKSIVHSWENGEARVGNNRNSSLQQVLGVTEHKTQCSRPT